MKVVWTAQAQARLAEIHAYIAKDQPLNATRFIDRLTRRGNQIGAHPYAARAERRQAEAGRFRHRRDWG